MEDLLIVCPLSKNSRISFLMEITLEVSCNAKDPWFFYLNDRRAKKLDTLKSALMVKINFLDR